MSTPWSNRESFLCQMDVCDPQGFNSNVKLSLIQRGATTSWAIIDTHVTRRSVDDSALSLRYNFQMNTMSRTTATEWAGRRLGRAWRGCLRQERHAIRWLTAKGLPAGAAQALFWIAKLVVFGVLLYAAFSLALLLLFAVAAAWVVHNSDHNEPEEWPMGDEADHRKSLFYDPINYNDDPDPRFEDVR